MIGFQFNIRSFLVKVQLIIEVILCRMVFISIGYMLELVSGRIRIKNIGIAFYSSVKQVLIGEKGQGILVIYIDINTGLE